MSNIFDLDVDIKNKNYINEPVVTQNDDVVFVLRVTDSGHGVDLSDYTSYSLTSLRPDGQSFLVAGTNLGDNQVEFSLGTLELEVTGTVKASIQLYKGGRVSSVPFTYKVLKDLSDDYTPTETELTFIQTVMDEAQQKIDELSDVDIVSLKAEVDQNYDDVTSQLAHKVTKGSVQKGYFDTSSDTKKLSLDNVNDEFRQALNGQAPVFSGLPERSIVDEYVASGSVGTRAISDYLNQNSIKLENYLGSIEDVIVDYKDVESGSFGYRANPGRTFINPNVATASGLVTLYTRLFPDTLTLDVHIVERGEGNSFRSIKKQTFPNGGGSALNIIKTDLIIEEGQYVGIRSPENLRQDQENPTPNLPFYNINADISDGAYYNMVTFEFDMAFYYQIGGKPNLLQTLLDNPPSGGTENINVKSLGALGDGVNDDSTAFQAALNLAKTNGRPVYIPPGNYFIDNTVIIPSSVVVFGEGRKSRLFYKENSSIPLTVIQLRGGELSVRRVLATEEGSENILLRDFLVEGVKDQNSTDEWVGIHLHGTRNSKIKDMYTDEINMFGDRGWGILVTESENVIIDGGLYRSSGYENIGIRDLSKYVLVTNTITTRGGRTCMQAVRSSFVHFVNNIIEQMETKPGYSHSAITTHYSSDITIEGNLIRSSVPSYNAGIHLVGGNERNQIINNNVDSAGNALRVESVGHIIMGNTLVSRNGFLGIDVRAGSVDGIIKGNRVISDGSFGIDLQADNNAVSGNYVTTNGSHSISVAGNDVRITNNRLETTNAGELTVGIRFSTCVNLVFSNNDVTVNGVTNSAKYSVLLIGVEKSRFLGNSFQSDGGNVFHISKGAKGSIKGINISDNIIKAANSALTLDKDIKNTLVKGNLFEGITGIRAGEGSVGSIIAFNDFTDTVTSYTVNPEEHTISMNIGG